jgi:hypothetical protein
MSAPDIEASGSRATRKHLPAKNARSTEIDVPSSLSRYALVDPDRREEMIRTAAYRRAESRGFSPGQEMDDWLAAEADIDEKLAHGEIPTVCGD